MGPADRPPRKPGTLKHRFFVPAGRFPASGEELAPFAVDRDTAHHMRQVLRLGPGAQVILFDDRGREYEARILESKPNRVIVQLLRALTPQVESPIEIALAQALIKGNAFDRMLTLATELGLGRIIPLVSARTVVKLNRTEIPDRVTRWVKIAQAASAQSGRVRVPVIEPPAELSDFLVRDLPGLKIILWEQAEAGQLKNLLQEPRPSAATLLAGPEGGFEESEVERAVAAGFKIWGLGPRILRAENAGAIAAALVQYELGDMG